MPPRAALTDEYKDALFDIYTDPANRGSYGGVKRLVESAKGAGLKVSHAQVAEWLSSQEVYTKYRTQRPNFQRRQVVSFGINWLWELDLAFFLDFWHENGGIKYLLCQIDVLSKVAHVIPIHDKSMASMIPALNKLFEEAGAIPEHISSDQGKEFMAKEADDLFKRRGINNYTMNDPKTGSPNVERFIRTLKGRIYKYMAQNNTKRYVDVLPQIVASYNNSYHRTIGMAPADVREKDVSRLRRKIYGRASRLFKRRVTNRYKLKQWQLVRVFKKRGPFSRGFKQQFDEICVVCRRIPTIPPTYKLCPLRLSKNGLPVPQQLVELQGAFYAEELVPIIYEPKAPEPKAEPEPPTPATIPQDWPKIPPEPRAYLPRKAKKPRNA